MMPLTIIKKPKNPQGAGVNKYPSKARLVWTQDKSKIVPEGEQEGTGFLYAAVGTLIPGEMVEKYGLEQHVEGYKKKSSKPKAQEPAENKAQAKGEDKGSKKGK
jgi:hypothetical protein